MNLREFKVAVLNSASILTNCEKDELAGVLNTVKADLRTVARSNVANIQNFTNEELNALHAELVTLRTSDDVWIVVGISKILEVLGGVLVPKGVPSDIFEI